MLTGEAAWPEEFAVNRCSFDPPELDAQGRVWITDFGLAKAEDLQSLTEPGDIVGTLRYMAPEMLSVRADARSDLCALGLTLYYLGLGDEQLMEIRNDAIACMALVDLRVIKQWQPPTTRVSHAYDVSPDLKYYATSSFTRLG